MDSAFASPQGLDLPRVGGVLGTEQVEARDMTAKTILFRSQLADLAGDVGRIDQRQGPAGRGGDVAFLNMGEIGVGRRFRSRLDSRPGNEKQGAEQEPHHLTLQSILPPEVV